MYGLLFSYVCSHVNPLFPPKIFFLPSLSVHAFVRVEQQPPFSCQTIKNENEKNKTEKEVVMLQYIKE